MKVFLTVALIIVGLLGCTGQQTTKPRDNSEPEVLSVADNDTEMAEAINKARMSIDSFDSALQSANTNYSFFALKAYLKNSNEHVWLRNITLNGGVYKGVLDNLPKSTAVQKVGDTISISSSIISDWMYLDNQKLRGGYSIRLLRKRMTEEERNQFDIESGFVIEE